MRSVFNYAYKRPWVLEVWFFVGWIGLTAFAWDLDLLKYSGVMFFGFVLQLHGLTDGWISSMKISFGEAK